MAANRKLPFGYEMRTGVTVIQSDEAEIVRWIYRQYAAGKSYESLTMELRQKEIPYQEGKVWNKNMVARILADERYLGKGCFPKLIDADLYDMVREKVPTKAPPMKKSVAAETIQRFAMCGVCGSTVYRDSYQHGKERWYCPNCRSITTKATDIRLERETKDLLTYLSQFPQTVVQEENCKNEYGDKINRMEKAYAQLLSTPDFQEDEAKTMVLALAAARYDALGSEDYETMRIQRLLTDSEPNEGLNIGLLRQITAAILIHPNGGVSLQLKNGQIIEKECFT